MVAGDLERSIVMATGKSLYVVTGDQYRVIDRRMREIKRQLDQDGGSPLDPDAVADVLQEIVEGCLPITMTVGGRTYEILGFLEGDENSVVGHKMVERAKEMSAHLGEDDGQHILEHQEDIPEALRGKVVFAFTDWRRPDGSDCVADVGWDGGRWRQDWDWLDDAFDSRYRVLRRK